METLRTSYTEREMCLLSFLLVTAAFVQGPWFAKRAEYVRITEIELG